MSRHFKVKCKANIIIILQFQNSTLLWMCVIVPLYFIFIFLLRLQFQCLVTVRRRFNLFFWLHSVSFVEHVEHLVTMSYDSVVIVYFYSWGKSRKYIIQTHWTEGNLPFFSYAIVVVSVCVCVHLSSTYSKEMENEHFARALKFIRKKSQNMKM